MKYLPTKQPENTRYTVCHEKKSKLNLAYSIVLQLYLRRLSPRGCVRFLLLKLLRFGWTLLCWGSPATGQVSCGMIQSWVRLLVIPLQVTGWLYRVGSFRV